MQGWRDMPNQVVPLAVVVQHHGKQRHQQDEDNRAAYDGEDDTRVVWEADIRCDVISISIQAVLYKKER
ncbi:hypothetical protein scyTo_0017865 [Scyliorhinus torazame]|uniref:Uncharacterized protein n=1 Tax=Scyliorhinus torazame TaxID=75743 RepID=A0A401Q1P8_SCYTO|nr:hypothetical protein [Scyliorhinus torazame]